MSVLTWRNVDAPSFRDSIDAYRLGTDTLNKAFDTGVQGIDDWDQQQTDAANTALQTDVARASTPEDIDAIKASLLTRSGADNIDATGLAALNARPQQLLNEATAKQQLATNVANADWTKSQRDRITQSLAQHDALKPYLSDLIDVAAKPYASASDYQSAINAHISGKPELAKALAGMSMEDQIGFRDTLNGLAKGTVGLQGSILGNESTALGNTVTRDTHGWDVQNHLDDQAAQAFVENNKSNFTDKGSFERFIADPNNVKGVSAGVIRRARQLAFGDAAALGLDGDPSAGGAGGGGGFGGGAIPGVGGADATRVMNYEAKASGFSAVPDSVKTMGDARDFARTVNRANKARTGEYGSSAMGLYQIVGDTMERYAPKVLGADWRSQPFNATNQDKIGAAIFADNRGSNEALRSQWTSLKKLSDADVSKIRAMPWEQARNAIAQGESGTNLTAAGRFMGITPEHGDSTRSAAMIQASLGTDERSQLAAFMQAHADDGASAFEVAQGLAKKFGDDPGMMEKKVSEVASNFKVNMTVAGHMIELAHDGQKNWFGHDFARLGRLINDGLNSNINKDRLNHYGTLFADKDGKFNPKQLADFIVKRDAQSRSVAGSQASDDLLNGLVRQRQAMVTRAVQFGRKVDTSQIDALIQQASGVQGGSHQIANTVANMDIPQPPPKAPPQQNRAAQTIAQASDPKDSRRFGPLGIYVPEGKFTNHDEMMGYVNTRTQMLQDAQGILRMSGRLGPALMNQYRSEFQQKYGVAPEKAASALARYQGRA